jgi:hypothetical protein
MGIEQNRDGKYEKEITTRSGGKYNETVYPYVVSCDYCAKKAYKMGETPGDAADLARKDNFTTVPAKSIALPSKWSCKSCKEKMCAKPSEAGLEGAFKKLERVVQSKKTG